MSKNEPPRPTSVSKLKTLEEQGREIMEAAEELENAIYGCIGALIDLGATHNEVIGMLFDMQCVYRELMYEE